MRHWRPPLGYRLREEWGLLRKGWVRFSVLCIDGDHLFWDLYEDRLQRWPIVFFSFLYFSLRARARALKARSA